MDPNDPTPAADNPTDIVADAPADPNAAGEGTGNEANNPTNPSKSTDTSAADGDKTPTAGDESAKDTPAPFDSDLDEWIEKRGLAKPTNDDEKRALQDMRNEQREFTRARQAEKDSENLSKAVADTKKTLDAEDGIDADSLEARLAAVEADRVAERNLRLQSEFYTNEKVTNEEHKLILDIFKEKVEKQPTDEAKLNAVNLWGSPEALPDLLDIARARVAKTVDTSEIVDKATQEERERIAKESQASSPSRSAKDNSPSDKTPDQERTERLKARYSSPK